MHRRKIELLLLALALPLLLGGCMLSASVESLYKLPQLPAEYKDLSVQIDKILAGSAEYTAPTSGAHLQSVQMEDLDGDGTAEVLAFFRTNSEERPLKIYVFHTADGVYRQAAVIEGSGTSVLSIRYTDMNRDGKKEILVSWRVSAEVQTLEAYILEEMEPVLLMSGAYARYEVVDLDGDGLQELMLLRGDDAESSGSLADYYRWDGGSLLLHSSARLSMSVAELQWMQTGRLQDGETAVFITGRVSGVEATSRAVTDILAYRQSELENIVLNPLTGISSEIFRYLSLQPTDINGDGVTEVPMPAQLPAVAEEGPYWKIYWRCYRSDGTFQVQAITYHNQADSWFLLIPEEWDGNFTVRQNNTNTTEHSTTFYSVQDGEPHESLFTIYTVTGSNRESQAVRNGRTILRRQPSTIYAAAFAQRYTEWYYAVARETLAQRFNIIVTAWNTGEN